MTTDLDYPTPASTPPPAVPLAAQDDRVADTARRNAAYPGAMTPIEAALRDAGFVDADAAKGKP